jgi:hypothetical protein
MSARTVLLSQLSSKLGFAFQESELSPGLRRRIGELESLKSQIDYSLYAIASKQSELMQLDLGKRKLSSQLFHARQYQLRIEEKNREISALNDSVGKLYSVLNSKVDILSNDIFSELSASHEGRVKNVPTVLSTQMVKETLREVVLIPCSHCKSLMPQTLTVCPNCGANRRG